MSRLLLLALLIAFATPVLPANLVKNPSFEEGLPEKTIRKRNYSPISGRTLLSSWVSPTKATPDLFNSEYSSGDKLRVARARTGRGVMGMVLSESKNLSSYYGGSHKEYIQGELKQGLERGKLYRVRFWLAHDRTSGFLAANIGAWLSADPFRQDNLLSIVKTPQVRMQDTVPVSAAMGWYKVEGDFYADGGERYITIGSFGNEFMVPLSGFGSGPLVSKGHTHRNAYYYIDDISVEEVKEYDPLPETEITSLVFVFDPSDERADRSNLDTWKAAFLGLGDQLPPQTLITVLLAGTQARSLCDHVPLSRAMTEIEQTISQLLPSKGSKGGFDRALRTAISGLKTTAAVPEHLIAVCRNTPALSNDTRRKIKDVFQKRDVTFSVVQWEGKEQSPLKRLALACEGNYFLSEKEPGAQLRDASFLGIHHRNLVHYSKDRSGKTLYYIGAGAVVALIIGSVI